jgi:hypothetical protein
LIHSSLVVTQHQATVASDPSSASVGAVAIQDGLSDSKDDLLRIDKRLPHSSKIYTCNPKLITIVDCGLALRERDNVAIVGLFRDSEVLILARLNIIITI